MRISLTAESIAAIAGRVAEANALFQQRYPGESAARQPVHTVYGGAQLFKAGTAQRLGGLALASLDEYAPDFATFARALGLPGAAELPEGDAALALADAFAQNEAATRRANQDAWLAWTVSRACTRSCAASRSRICGSTSRMATAAAPMPRRMATLSPWPSSSPLGMATGSLPPCTGIRIKSFAPETFGRAVRTLDIVLGELAARSDGQLPDHFVVTLPKVALAEHVTALADLLDLLEARCGIAPGAVGIDLMIEAPQAIVGPRGTSAIGALVQAGRGRVASAAFGTYDYTASLGITARYQEHTHPAAHFARQIMQASLAGTGVALSDSVTDDPADRAAARRAGPDAQRAATNREPRGRPRRLAAALRQHPALAAARLLPELGSAPGPAAGALRRRLHLLPGKPARRRAPPERLPRPRGPGHAGRQHLRRRGDGPGAAQLLPARAGLRRADGGRGAGHRHHA